MDASSFINATESFDLTQHGTGRTHIRGQTPHLAFTAGVNVDAVFFFGAFDFRTHNCVLFDLSLNLSILPCHCAIV